MKNIVFGATGFIGSNLANSLIKKEETIAFVRKSSNTKILNPKIKIMYGDLNNINSIQKIIQDNITIFNVSGLLGGPNISYKQLYNANVKCTENILKASKNKKIKRFIHFSSVAAIGNPSSIANEETKCNPISGYDKTKYESEIIVKKYCKQYNISYTIVRPSFVYGPGEIKNKARMFTYIKKGIFRIIGNGNNLLSVIYIENLIHAINLIMKNKKSINKIYILADPTITMKEFVNAIAKTQNVKYPKHISLKSAILIADIFSLINKIIKIPSPLTKDRIRTLTLNRHFDTTKAIKELNFKPVINLEEAMKKTVKWYKNQGII